MGLALILIASGARAGESLDHDEIKRLRETGEILSMVEVMRRAAGVQPGQLLEAELEREDGAYVYEIKILAPDGSLHELYLDAATAEILDWGDR